MDGNRYLFFRDLDNDSNADGDLSYHAYGIVDKVFNEEATFSGKDLSVSFLDLANAMVVSQWRTYKEVELFDVDEFTYNKLKELLDDRK